MRSTWQVTFRAIALAIGAFLIWQVSSPQLLRAAPLSQASTITGIVFRDFNSNGQQETNPPVLDEPGVGGLTLTAYDADGNVVGTTTSSSASATLGQYTLAVSVAAGTDVRIELTGLPTFLYPGQFGSGSSTTVGTVQGGDIGVDFGIANPGQHCQSNPELTTSCYVLDDQQTGPNAGAEVLVSFDYTSGASAPFPSAGDHTTPAHVNEAIASQIGPTWGLAYQRSSRSIFAAAFMKRHTGFGPGGTGTIYRIDRSTSPNTVSAFLDFNTLFGAGTAGTDPHPAGTNFFFDGGSWDDVGKIAFGDLDISDDDLTLWTINLNDRLLYEIPIGGSPSDPSNPVAPAAGDIDTWPSSGNLTGLTGLTACGPSNADIRPFALAYHDGLVYVGMVCSAETAPQTDADLRAYVYSFDPATDTFTQRLSFSLEGGNTGTEPMTRRCGDKAGDADCYTSANNADWVPWLNSGTTTIFGAGGLFPSPGFFVEPEPLLTDIEFDGFGNMILGFRDRFGDQMGNNSGDFGPVNVADFYTGIAAGDILRACGNPTTGWTLEANGTCGGITTAGADTTPADPMDDQGPGRGEYYFQEEYFQSTPRGSVGYDPNHDETALGGLVQVPGLPDVATTVFDPALGTGTAGWHQGGVGWFTHSDGTTARTYTVYTGQQGPTIPTFGKANGLGDLEAFCNAAPLEIGNYVWEDLDQNGRQDPNEPVFENVVLSLYKDTTGDGTPDTLVATTTTDSTGQYIFNATTIQAYLTAQSVTPVAGVHFSDLNGNTTFDSGEPFGVLPAMTYEIRIEDPDNFGVGDPLENFFATTVNTTTLADGQDDIRDSDGAVGDPAAIAGVGNVPTVLLTTGPVGANNHTYDFGFVTTVPPDPDPTPSPPLPGDPNGDRDLPAILPELGFAPVEQSEASGRENDVQGIALVVTGAIALFALYLTRRRSVP